MAAVPGNELQQRVKQFWETAGRGDGDPGAGGSTARYRLEPCLPAFADFARGKDRDVLEIGVGSGHDHVQWARAGPRSLHGIDLAEGAIRATAARLARSGLSSQLQTADARALPFADGSFDVVYAWGVLHHSAEPSRAIREVRRVLRPGGRAKVMIYHAWSVAGYRLWLRHALLAGRPHRRLRDLYFEHPETPCTRAYTIPEAQELFRGFASADIRPCLNHGDLLEGRGDRPTPGPLVGWTRALWPRWLIRRLLPAHGSYLLIDATA